MKIIGESADGFIMEANKNEVYNLVGYYSKYSEKCPKLFVGAIIEVHQMFRQLYDLHSKRKELKELSARLRTYATALEEVVPVTVMVGEE